VNRPCGELVQGFHTGWKHSGSAARTANTDLTDTCGSKPLTSAGREEQPFALRNEKEMVEEPMRRREFLILSGGLILTAGSAREALAQLPKIQKKDTYKVGFAQTESNNPWRIAQTKSMQDEARKRNWQLVYTDAAGSAAKQVADVNSMIAQKVDAIFLAPREEKPLIPAVMAAKRAGIPVILLDRSVDPSLAKPGEDYITFIGSTSSRKAAAPANGSPRP
jgi:ribose transport system substrate-binding protein